MTVTATVVRSCVVETEASPGAGGTANASAQLRVTLTCSQNTLPSRRQTLTGTPGPSADTVPRHARTITLAADGRAVILF